RRRLPDLRRADAAARLAAPRYAALGLLLPDQRLDDELRLLLGRRPQREDHLGQALGLDPEVHHRVRRDDRRAADVRSRARRISTCPRSPRPSPYPPNGSRPTRPSSIGSRAGATPSFSSTRRATWPCARSTS